MQIQNIQNTNAFRQFNIPEINTAKSQVSLNKKIQTPPSDIEKASKKSAKKIIMPLFGAILGTFIPLVALNKLEGKVLNTDILKNGKFLEKLKEIAQYFKIDDAKRILTTGITSIIGGLLGGIAIDKNKENKKEKIKEALFESINVTLPTVIAAGTLEILKSKNKDKGFMKLIPFVLGLGTGIPLASKISGKISQKIFKDDESKTRKFHPKDFLVHTDDMVDALVLLKFPFVDKLQIDKILALIYVKCGFEAGSKESKNQNL